MNLLSQAYILTGEHVVLALVHGWPDQPEPVRRSHGFCDLLRVPLAGAPVERPALPQVSKPDVMQFKSDWGSLLHVHPGMLY